jgi:magnesium transporter
VLKLTVGEDGVERSFCYLSDLFGKRVYSKDGKYAGKFYDVMAVLHEKHPEIRGFILDKGATKRSYPIEIIDLMNLAALREVRLTEREPQTYQPGENSFLVRKVLYDRQIVDVEGAKVERVNDIRIMFSDGRSFLVQVDVGFSGLIRRLGFDKVVRWLARIIGIEPKESLIEWKFVQPLPETGIGPISLSLRQEQIRLLHAGELAEILEDLDRGERISLVQSIGAEEAADVLEEADISVQTSILRDLDTELAADILEEMEPAVVADIFEKLPSEAQESLLAAMEDEERAQIELLVQAPPESVASLMTVDFISCPGTHNCSQALALLRQYADEIESITYVYCTDEEQHLRGVVSLRNLILAEPTSSLSAIMNQRLVTLGLSDDWDAVAGQFLKLRFKALPVVDADDHMLGIVTFMHSFDELIPYYSKLVART